MTDHVRGNTLLAGAVRVCPAADLVHLETRKVVPGGPKACAAADAAATMTAAVAGAVPGYAAGQPRRRTLAFCLRRTICFISPVARMRRRLYLARAAPFFLAVFPLVMDQTPSIFAVVLQEGLLLKGCREKSNSLRPMAVPQGEAGLPLDMMMLGKHGALRDGLLQAAEAGRFHPVAAPAPSSTVSHSLRHPSSSRLV